MSVKNIVNVSLRVILETKIQINVKILGNVNFETFLKSLFVVCLFLMKHIYLLINLN